MKGTEIRILVIVVLLMAIGIISFSKDHYNITANMPLRIVYKSPAPPDSIQDFLKLYLQHTKSADIISENQYMELFKKTMEDKMRELIQKGDLNEKTAKEIGFTPICNLLVLRFFSGQTNNSDVYKIDSLHWDIKVLPAKDTSSVWKSYIPNNAGSNVFDCLKEFCTYITKSKLLK